jgi:hypothetical protein
MSVHPRVLQLPQNLEQQPLAYNMKHELTQLDNAQLPRYMYDAENQAQRVVLVGGSDIQINAQVQQQPQIETRIEKIEVPVIVKELSVQQVNVPVIIKEVQIERIEIPVIVKEVELRVVKTDVVVTKHEVIQIEKPIFIEKSTQLPKWVFACMAIQALSSFGLLVSHILK